MESTGPTRIEPPDSSLMNPWLYPLGSSTECYCQYRHCSDSFAFKAILLAACNISLCALALTIVSCSSNFGLSIYLGK